MKRLRMVLWATLCVVGILGAAEAAVIGFDDIPIGPPAPIASDYQGFYWDDQWGVESDYVYTKIYENSYGAPSAENAAFNWCGMESVSLTAGSHFDFVGAYFTSWAGEDEEEWYSSTTITIEGYKNGSFVDSVTAELSFNQYDWIGANFAGVDELVFVSSGDLKWWLMDNFTYNAAPVPEPATVLLLGAGLVGLISVRKKRQK